MSDQDAIPADAVLITFEGAAAAQHATRLQQLLSSPGATPAITDRTPREGELGAATIILTFIASKLAKSAAKVAIGRVRAFLKERIERGERQLQLRVDVNGAEKKKLPFSLTQATLETVDSFCADIEQAINSL